MFAPTCSSKSQPKNLVTNMRYFIFSEISYDFLKQRHQILAEKLNKHYDILFIERVPSRLPGDVLTRIYKGIRERGRKQSRKKKSVGNYIETFKSMMLPDLNGVFRVYNSIRLRRLLKRAARGDIIHLYANNPSIAAAAKRKGCFLIVDIVHNWWCFPYHAQTQRRNINKVVNLADLVISDSELTLSLAKQNCSDSDKEFLLLPPGVDDLWFSTSIKDDFQETTEFKASFFGNLRANSDLELLRELSTIERTKIEILGLLDQSLPSNEYKWLNKFYDGNYKVSDLVSKLKTADAILLPYDRSAFSSSIFPAKYFEAMALGKPIISNSQMTHLPMWNKFIWTSDEVKRLGWENLCRQHYEHRYLKQVQFARENSWNGRVQTLKESICRVL